MPRLPTLHVTHEGLVITLRSSEIWRAIPCFQTSGTQFYRTRDYTGTWRFKGRDVSIPLYSKVSDEEIKIGRSAWRRNRQVLRSLFSVKETGEEPLTILSFRGYKNPVQLRDYQGDAFMAAVDARYGIIQLPTGAGKTEILLSLAGFLTFKGLRVLVLAANRSGESEIATRGKAYGFPIQAFRDSELLPKDSITVSTVATLMNNAKKRLTRMDVVIFDECHHLQAESWTRLFETVMPKRAYGFSATAYTDDAASKAVLKAYLGKIIFKEAASSPRIAKWLNIPVLLHLPWRADFPMVSSNDWLDIQEYQYHPSRLQCIAKAARMMMKQGITTFIPLTLKDAGLRLREMLPEAVCWYGGGEVHGWDNGSDFKSMKKGIESGEIQIVIGTSHMDEAVNLPSLDAVLLSEGKMTRRALQRAGRGMRKSDKGCTILLNLGFDNHSVLSRHSDSRVNALSKEYGLEPKQVTLETLKATLKKERSQ